MPPNSEHATWCEEARRLLAPEASCLVCAKQKSRAMVARLRERQFEGWTAVRCATSL